MRPVLFYLGALLPRRRFEGGTPSDRGQSAAARRFIVADEAAHSLLERAATWAPHGTAQFSSSPTRATPPPSKNSSATTTTIFPPHPQHQRPRSKKPTAALAPRHAGKPAGFAAQNRRSQRATTVIESDRLSRPRRKPSNPPTIARNSTARRSSAAGQINRRRALLANELMRRLDLKIDHPLPLRPSRGNPRLISRPVATDLRGATTDPKISAAHRPAPALTPDITWEHGPTASTSLSALPPSRRPRRSSLHHLGKLNAS